MFRLVLFDIDGTLIHPDGAGVKAFGKVFETLFKIPRATHGVRFAGRTDTSLAREIFTRNQIPATPENFGAFFEQYAFWLAHLLTQTRGDIYPGVWRFIYELQRLAAPPVVGLLTGNIRLGAEIKLRHFNLWEFFQTGAFGDEREDRRQIAALARDRGARILSREIRPDQILVVGDTPLDIDCARAIGAEVIAVATGDFTLAELGEHRPTWAVPNLDHLNVRELFREPSAARRGLVGMTAVPAAAP